MLVLIILFPAIAINENNFRNVSGSTRPRTKVVLAKVPGTQNLVTKVIEKTAWITTRSLKGGRGSTFSASSTVTQAGS